MPEADRKRWRVVHQSFVDFLDEEDMVHLGATHDRVATLYLSRLGWPGRGPSRLVRPRRRVDLDGYGLRHMAEHLERAGRFDDLHRLLRLERRVDGAEDCGSVRTENVWYTVPRARLDQPASGYMNDLIGPHDWCKSSIGRAPSRASTRHASDWRFVMP